MPAVPKLVEPFPFRRVAVVLAGGGAYEAGVLRVLERAGLRPAVLAGTSAGAINAVIWRAHDFRTDVLQGAWRGLRPASVGMRWTTLTLRAGGGLLVALGVLQAVLGLLGSPEIAFSRKIWGPSSERQAALSAVLDALAWVLVAGMGTLALALSRRAEDWLASAEGARDPTRLSRRLGAALLVGLTLHLATWVLGLPWPHRFSASLLAATALVWLAVRPSAVADRARAVLLGLMPETRGRGLWRGAGRRRLLEGLVAQGQPERLTGSETLLVVTALAVDSGRIAHFVSGPDPGPRFREAVERHLGEVIHVDRPAEVIEAAVASSAIPLMFEPVSIRGRQFVDAGQFSNQPLAAVHAADADAAVVVLMAPTSQPPKSSGEENLVALGARLVELANWRALQQELRELPSDWLEARPGGARAVVVVAPEAPLPGGLLSFGEAIATELMLQGELDAWRALDTARWLAPREA